MFTSPGLRISSSEPHPDNFALFDRNLSLNSVRKIRLYPEAIYGDGPPVSLESLFHIERMCGEFHSNRLLERRGYSPHNLLKYCEDLLTPSRVRVELMAMSE